MHGLVGNHHLRERVEERRTRVEYSSADRVQHSVFSGPESVSLVRPFTHLAQIVRQSFASLGVAKRHVGHHGRVQSVKRTHGVGQQTENVGDFINLSVGVLSVLVGQMKHVLEVMGQQPVQKTAFVGRRCQQMRTKHADQTQVHVQSRDPILRQRLQTRLRDGEFVQTVSVHFCLIDQSGRVGQGQFLQRLARHLLLHDHHTPVLHGATKSTDGVDVPDPLHVMDGGDGFRSKVAADVGALGSVGRACDVGHCDAAIQNVFDHGTHVGILLARRLVTRHSGHCSVVKNNRTTSGLHIRLGLVLERSRREASLFQNQTYVGEPTQHKKNQNDDDDVYNTIHTGRHTGRHLPSMFLNMSDTMWLQSDFL
ncbi:hypothetical protein [Cyprinid herpesvirus 2]|nr:hypothetical protein [Cyprinid herpesvirus 2]